MVHQPSLSHTDVHHHRHAKRDVCQTYLSPAAGDVIEAYDHVTLKWDPSCLTNYKVLDLYLQSVDAAQPIHVWKSVTTSDGQLETSFIPSWWNATNASTLQLVITGLDQPAWAGSGPGPTFFAEFNGTIPSSVPDADRATTQSAGPSVEVINKPTSHGLPIASLTTAVVVPLLFVATLITIYIIIARRRSGAASKRWTMYVDQQMSASPNAPRWEAGRLPTDPALPRPASARVASMYRHSASLPSRGSIAANSINRFSSAASTGPHMSQHRQSTISFADAPHPNHRTPKSSLSINTSLPSDRTPLELLISPDQEHGPSTLARVLPITPKSNPTGPFKPGHAASASMARSTSNLRFELGNKSTTSTTSAKTAPVNPTKKATDDTTTSTFDMPWDNNTFWQTNPRPSNNSSRSADSTGGMRRLSNISTLSPDEALRQYTLGRERVGGTPAPDEPTPTSSSTGMRVLYSPHLNTPPSAMARNMQSVYTEASRYSTSSAGTFANQPPMPPQ